jgi:hypothetical protein
MLLSAVSGADKPWGGKFMRDQESRIRRHFLTGVLALLFLASASIVSAPVAAAGDDDEEHHERAVHEIIEKYNIEIKYDYIAMLMRLPNAYGEGAACVLCHNSTDPKRSPRGLDLSTCQGIKNGPTDEHTKDFIKPGNGKGSLIRRYLRNNRMPLGVRFDTPTDLPAIKLVKKWIDDGAKNDEVFRDKILPSFRSPTAYGGEQSCIECHMSNQEPPSFHELDLTSYTGLMLGADAIAKAKEGKPPVKVVIPGDSSASKIYQRLVENRMPAGISPSENRDHPNLTVLLRWVDQGAKCD